MHEFRRILRETLFVPILTLLLLAGFVLGQIWNTDKAQMWLDHSDDITDQIQTLSVLVVDQETGLRGFQLTNDPVMLTPYHAAAPQIESAFSSLDRLIGSDAEQRAALVQVHDRYSLWLGFAEPILAGKAGAANDHDLNLRGKQLMDHLRSGLNDMRMIQEHQRRRRSALVHRREHEEFLAILISAILVGVFLGFFTRGRIRNMSRSYNRALEEADQRTEEAAESRQWFRTTLESIGDAVIACDIEGRVNFMNAIAETLTGWDVDDAQGEPLHEVFYIINETTRERCENPVEKVLRLRTVVGLANHTALISRDGAEYVIDDSAAPILDADGRLTGIVLVFRDVTEARRSEAALIASEKLAVAGRLAASIAHEIHNPLDSVANLHFLLSGESDAAKRAEYLKLAQQEVSRTMQISRTMLSLYREPNAPVQVDLSDLIDGVLLLLDRRLKQLGITVEKSTFASLHVEGFPAELRQVFTNIILNAAEAAGHDGRIHIHMEEAPAEELHGAGAIVEVTDSGPGISESASQKLFQPFYTTKGEDGTGLGLWVSMGIVQKHGGAIRIGNGSVNGLQGASIRVYLPSRTMASAATRSTPQLL
nr:CHASE3 domain-containing protein [Paracidobacterium acidisoli]